MAHFIKAEILKLKSTLAALFLLLGPLLIVLLMIIQTTQIGPGFLQGSTPARYYIQNNLSLWALLLVPFFITLETALSALIEHKTNTWKALLVTGISRVRLFTAKLLVNTGLVLLAYVLLFLFILAGGWLLAALMPDFGSFAAEDLAYLSSKIPLIALFTLPLVPIHFWIAHRWNNILVAFGFGVVVTITNFLVVNSAFKQVSPWSLTVLAAQAESAIGPANIAYAIGVFIIASALVVRDLSLKEYF